MLGWLLLCFALTVASEFVCPFVIDNNSSAARSEDQRLLHDCMPITIKGLCNKNLVCVARTYDRQPCVSKLPCSTYKEACTCPGAVACQRLLSAPRKPVRLICTDGASNQHPKRQESHESDSDSDDDDDGDTNEIDGTLVFVFIFLLSYCVLLCLAVIYIKPVD